MAIIQVSEANDSDGDTNGSGTVFLSTIEEPLFYTFCALASLLLVLDVVCLVFFILFRKRKVVQLTSPKLNYLIVMAVFFLCLSAIFYPFPTTDLVALRILCPIRAVSLSLLGYDLCFAVLLVKLWRIYHIFHNPRPTKKVIKDKHLLVGIFILLLPDLLIYVVLLPLEIAKPDIGMEINKEEPYIVNEMGESEENFFLTCGNSVYFIVRIVLTATYKIFLQGITIIMAIKIRKVKIPSLNDTRYVSIMVYIATALSIIILSVSLTLVDYPNIYAALFAASSLVGGGSFLGLLFIPKMVILYHDPEGQKVFQTSDMEQSHSSRLNGSVDMLGPSVPLNGVSSQSFQGASTLPTKSQLLHFKGLQGREMQRTL